METNKTPTSMPEHLSALLDDEAGSFEQKRVLDELSTNNALRDKLSTYALIGETMRSSDMEKPVLNLNSSFLAGIHAKIEEEEQYHDVQIAKVADGQSARSQSWIKPLGSFALVASVAAVAVVGLQNFQQSRMTEPTALVAMNNASSKTMVAQKDQLTEDEMSSAQQISAADLVSNNLTANNEPMAATQEYAQADTQTRSLLKRYVDSHMQYASNAAFVPSVRVIAYTDNQ